MSPALAAPAGVSFAPSADEVDAHDFLEVTVTVEGPSAKNPFTDASVSGWLRREGGERVEVAGFADSDDGSVHRIRFMPSKPGKHAYGVSYREGDFLREHKGSFVARDGKRRGLVRVDPAHPWHFLWEGTGEHYFWNGTTTYWLLGWKDDETIRGVVDRLAALGVNRIRVALCGRTKDGGRWREPLVQPIDHFAFRLNPWVAARPDSVEDPGFDVTRFNVEHWRKAERLLRRAREKDVVVSIIFYLDGMDPGVDPFGKQGCGSEDEKRYYRYAAARLAAFSNVMWDIANEYQLFRNEACVEKIAPVLDAADPYGHLTSVHGHEDFKFRKSPWADFAMYQSWDEHGGHEFLLKHRRLQAESGRPMPQVNEEYGYEDHYPTWGENRRPPARSADNRRRLAWGMYMAGSYQTTGERADRGTGAGPDTGGGWINGRGDDEMVMLRGYGRIADFFGTFEWWKTDPHDELVTGGAMCLAEPGRQYAVYLRAGGKTTVKLAPGKYAARRFNPRTGEWAALGTAEGPEWTSQEMPDREDWAVLVRTTP
jgi:hypothetical protein